MKNWCTESRARSEFSAKGDIISVDCGTVFEGFVADLVFTFAVGKISPEAKRLMEITEGALVAAIDKMRAGNRTGDISATI